MRRASPIVIAGSLTLVAAIFTVPALLLQDIHREWAASHKALYQYIEPVDSIAYRVNGLINRVDVRLFGSSEPGLEQVRLYVSEQKLRALQHDLPRSVKNWKKGRMLYPDGSLENVRVRHRGDNPFNWLYQKKSWRIKTRKERMIGNVRVFNLIAPQDPVFIDTHFYLRLAHNCGVLAGGSRMVELVLNGKTQGVHTEVAQLDENFLRNNNLMPVNLYKGEQRMSERRFGLEFDLYSGPALWSKDSLNNYTLDPASSDPVTDVSDLAYVLRTTQEAIADKESFERLRSIVDWDYWSRFAAYEILTQHSYDALHNNRLMADIWKGQVLPLPIDPQAERFSGPQDVRLYRFGSRQGILDRLERSPEFRMATMRKLKKMLESGCLQETVDEIRTLLPKLLISLSRDDAIYQALGSRSYRNFDPETEIRAFLDGYGMVARELGRQLTAAAPVTWSAQAGALNLISSGPVPEGPWIARLEKTQALSSEIEVWWDRNGDGSIGAADMRLPAERIEDGVRINAGFAGNFQRQTSVDQMLVENYGSTPRIQPAAFRLLFNHRGLKVTSLIHEAHSRPVERTQETPDAVSPNSLNEPVSFADPPVETVVYSGRVRLEGPTVIDQPVRVEAGTIFEMGESASIVFRGRTSMDGTKDRPIRFEPAAGSRHWGVVALQGAGATKSVLRHVEMKGGTGASVGLTRFIAMLSVHDTSDILLDGLVLSENSVEDDMVHVIYGRNVTIRNIRMIGAMSDAIDIDVSSVKIIGGSIERSGNDAIDLMASTATIEDIRLVGNGDKGVSVGEGSRAKIIKADIRANEIGVQSKDGSLAIIERSRFEQNRLQLSAYQKNWRYGDGGRIGVRDGEFVTRDGAGAFSADPKSRIDIGNSKLAGPVRIEGLVIGGGKRLKPTVNPSR